VEKIANRVVRNYSINDFLNWRDHGELVLVPWFQRREVWHTKARSYLIDTILRNLPVPIIILRESIDPRTGKTIREIVDGQQRLRSVFEFYDGQLAINKAHRKDLAGKTFSDLEHGLRDSFRQYEFSVNVLHGTSNAEVLDIFARINSYMITLNRQEKLNAQYHGEFKTFVYRVGSENLDFFLENRILSRRAVFRMAEAEAISELVIGMLAGLQDKKKTIEDFYKNYDEDFPQGEDIEAKFVEMLRKVENILGPDIKETNFRRVPMFYSLFLVLFDLEHGLPGQTTGERHHITSEEYDPIKEKLRNLSEIIDEEEPRSVDVDFIRACIQSTDLLKSRQIRHDRIRSEILDAIESSD